VKAGDPWLFLREALIYLVSPCPGALAARGALIGGRLELAGPSLRSTRPALRSGDLTFKSRHPAVEGLDIAPGGASAEHQQGGGTHQAGLEGLCFQHGFLPVSASPAPMCPWVIETLYFSGQTQGFLCRDFFNLG
jgi:hypothetical protein